MLNIHKMPVRMVRLSKKSVNMLVSCGDEADLYVKLWNVGQIVSGKDIEPSRQVQTNQIKHKTMAQAAQSDLYGVAAKTNEVKLY